jgi:FkbM family methyltransferase
MIVPWNDFVGVRIFERGYYEPETVEIVKKFLRQGSIFIDAGAHLGQYTLVASQCVGRQGQVHSFEPNPATFRWLARNIELNRLENVQLNQLALTEKEEERELFLSGAENIGATSLIKPQPYFFSGKSCQVPCSTLERYMNAKGLARAEVLKIDVEGAELKMLKGAKSLLEGENKPAIIIEFNEQTLKPFGTSKVQLARFLEKKGYRLFRITRPPLKPYTSKEDVGLFPVNVLALPREKEYMVSRLSKSIYKRKN